jgi:hypothetical protein
LWSHYFLGWIYFYDTYHYVLCYLVDRFISICENTICRFLNFSWPCVTSRLGSNINYIINFIKPFPSIPNKANVKASESIVVVIWWLRGAVDSRRQGRLLPEIVGYIHPLNAKVLKLVSAWSRSKHLLSTSFHYT